MDEPLKIMLSDKSQKQSNHTFYDSIYMLYPEQMSPWGHQVVVPWTGGESGRHRQWWLMTLEFLSVVKNALIDYSDGCTSL